MADYILSVPFINNSFKIRIELIQLSSSSGSCNTNSISGRSRQNVDQVLSQENLAKNEIFVDFHSNLEILGGFQKTCDPVWIRHWV